MPAIKSKSSCSAKFKNVCSAAAPAAVIVTVIGALGGGVYGIHRGVESVREPQRQLLIEAFNKGEKRVFFDNTDTVYGVVSSLDKDGNTVLSAHAAEDFDGNGVITKMSGSVKISVKLPAKAPQTN